MGYLYSPLPVSMRTSKGTTTSIADHNYLSNTKKKQYYPRKGHRAILLTVVCFVLAIWLFASQYLMRPPPIDLEPTIKLPQEIPNIVHFVRQMNRNIDGSPRPLQFEFRHFMAYYSASWILNPDEINIWSDADNTTIENAKLHGDVYTKATLNLPGLQFRYVEMPTTTSTGVPITEYAHKSDFVRTRVMAEYGGQYFDDDSWVIRDLAPFRKAGFENVFGKQATGDLCQATWMSTPNNTLMRAFERLQETEFNGEWVRASNVLISNLVYDVTGLGHDRYALVLEHNAFFPGGWDAGSEGLPKTYQVHREDDEGTEPTITPNSVEDLVNHYNFIRNWGWRRDWRNSYVIHGYSNAIREQKGEWLFNPFGGFTLEYVLARQSNIARALYPALQSALQSGALKLGDTEPPVQQMPIT